MTEKKILNFQGKCFICGKEIGPQKIKCVKCGQYCKPLLPEELSKAPPGTKVIIDVKSDCCREDIEFIGNITCSKMCHDEWVLNFEMDLGEYQKLIDKNGIEHKIPTRDIIEKQITQIEIENYPLWIDNEIRKCKYKDSEYI